MDCQCSGPYMFFPLQLDSRESNLAVLGFTATAKPTADELKKAYKAWPVHGDLTTVWLEKAVRANLKVSMDATLENALIHLWFGSFMLFLLKAYVELQRICRLFLLNGRPWLCAGTRIDLTIVIVEQKPLPTSESSGQHMTLRQKIIRALGFRVSFDSPLHKYYIVLLFIICSFKLGSWYTCLEMIQLCLSMVQDVADPTEGYWRCSAASTEAIYQQNTWCETEKEGASGTRCLLLFVCVWVAERDWLE